MTWMWLVLTDTSTFINITFCICFPLISTICTQNCWMYYLKKESMKMEDICLMKQRYYSCTSNCCLSPYPISAENIFPFSTFAFWSGRSRFYLLLELIKVGIHPCCVPLHIWYWCNIALAAFLKLVIQFNRAAICWFRESRMSLYLLCKDNL